MKTIDNFFFFQKTAIVRVDFNVPLNYNLTITDSTRIKYSIPTIKKIIHDGGKVVLISHLGNPKKDEKKKFSLEILIPQISKELKIPVKFFPDCIGKKVKNTVFNMKNGEVILLENLRFYEEEKKENENFAFQLSNLGDIYVNDAFGVSHRSHSSITTITKFFPNSKCVGYLMMKEIKAINKILKNPKKPVLGIIGGAKISSKIPIIKNLISILDNLIIGGGISYTFIKSQGGKIGNSIIENDKIFTAFNILKEAKKKGTKIYLPIDCHITKDINKYSNQKYFCNINEIPNGFKGLDIGPLSIKKFSKIIKNSKTILWNGPMGVFELDKFSNGTLSIAKEVSKSTKNGSFSLVGGGDSIAAIKKLGHKNNISYISTGGGAMLESLKGKELIGIKYIKK
jgi:phosphoglycerate kinase